MVHNKYGKPSGEEVMVSRIVELLLQHKHDVHAFVEVVARSIIRGAGKPKPFTMLSIRLVAGSKYSKLPRAFN